MSKGVILFLAGGIWELSRFVAVFIVSTFLLASIPDAHVNLLWLGAPAILLSAVFFSAAYYPSRVGAYLPILRIGTAVAVVSDMVVVVTGSYNWVPDGGLLPAIGEGRVVFLAAFGILVVELILLSLLISFRAEPATGQVPTEGQQPAQQPDPETPMDEEQLPEYDPTDLDRM